ncbi:polyprenyl synthetase family protein [Acidiferrobacter sp. SPIII_3]|uniref:polyprenyl synthetase family protein n=1 Tax=Acidiferrobacter sp. SPIII_3 TaxID=1281578 RepID=UPI00197AC34F|nr:farnesyl diphosphate synthase [Acidiferrobacter sp. SPIII_3]
MVSEDQLKGYRARVEDVLARTLPSMETVPMDLHEAMRYATLGGGKRLRACLVYATGEALGATPEALDPPAAAVELIHAYSLVHDDLPCMDDDDMRRGRPSCHKAFGEATALLAGDALQTQAFAVLAAAETLSPHARMRMVEELARASGSLGMAGGQALDLKAGPVATIEVLEERHGRKTGALMHAAVRLGALAATPEIPSALDDYGRALGLAFQIADDLLDVEGVALVVGKTIGADAAAGKATFASVLGVKEARRRARDLYENGLASLRFLGDNGRLLATIAHYAVERDH